MSGPKESVRGEGTHGHDGRAPDHDQMRTTCDVVVNPLLFGVDLEQFWKSSSIVTFVSACCSQTAGIYFPCRRLSYTGAYLKRSV